LDDLRKLNACYTISCNLIEENETYKILNHFIWKTRYGKFVHDYAIIALFFERITPQQLQNFTETLFKMLIPPSLFWAKQVNMVIKDLYDILLRISSPSGADIFFVLNEYTKKYRDLFEKACDQEIAGYNTWKRLVCLLCEYLQNPEISSAQLFNQGTDIEHIQCFTDQEDPEKIKNEWKEELNRLGNLVLLESNLNRSINNKHNKKEECYRQSVYKTVQALADCVSSWNKEAAENRRRELTDKMAAYIFSTGTGH